MAKQPHAGPPRPICFMVMPFGEKQTGAANAPDKVDFDRLWHAALKPGIEACGYRAVRADEDLGAVILKDMLERLVAADLVIADVTLSNANVYYELGLRHAACRTGCVMIAADWARPAFDIAQITRFKYPLPQTTINDEEAAEIRQRVESSLPDAVRQLSPVHELVPNYPNVSPNSLDAFRDEMREVYDFQSEIRRIELLSDKKERDRERKKVVKDALKAPTTLNSVVSTLIALIRDTGDWNELLTFLEELPPHLRDTPMVEEQRALALSGIGKDADAIAAIEQHLRRHGETPEGLGIIGGRYKRLYDQAKNAKHLNAAIAAYERGWRLDLNAYYPGCNLPLLLREHGARGDVERATAINNVVIEACDAARALGYADDWLNSTLLVATFVTGEVDKARDLLDTVKREGTTAWRLKATLLDLKRCLGQLDDGHEKAGLAAIYEELQSLASSEAR